MKFLPLRIARAKLLTHGVGALVTLVAAFGTATASDLADAIGKAAGDNYAKRVQYDGPGKLVSREARLGYKFQPSFTRARGRIAIRVGGVLIGAPAQGELQLDPDGFDYELLPEVPDQPRRVRLDLKTAQGESWSFEAPAATITVMSLMAADRRPVVLTLTEEDGVGGEVGPFQGVVVHPAVERTRLVYHFGWVDTLADMRLSDGMRSVLGAANARLELYQSLVDVYTDPKKDPEFEVIEAELAEVKLLDEEWYDSTPALFGRRNPGDLPPVEKTEGAIVALMARSCRSSTFAELIEGHVRGTTSAEDLIEAVRADGLARKHAGVEPPAAEMLLSMVEERSWTISPQTLTPPKVGRKPRRDDFLMDVKHRLVYDDDLVEEWLEKFGEEGLEDRYAELGLTQQLWGGISDSLTPIEQRTLQEINEAVVVYRLVHAACEGNLKNFPQDKWVDLLAEVKDIHQANERVSTAGMFQAASRWNQFSWATYQTRRRTPDQADLAPVMPARLPDRIRLK
jgi:hypothetical protein